MPNPLRPGTHKHPTGQRLNVSLAFALNKNKWQRAAKKINDTVERIPSVKRDVPKEDAPTVKKSEKRTATLAKNAARYDYLLDAESMERTMAAIDQILKQDILDGSDFWTRRFFLNPSIKSSIEDGTTDSFDSAVRITAGTPVEANISALSARQQLQSPAYADRLRLTYGRVFEEMKGLTAEVKSQLRLTLTEGVARGVGIRDLKGMINKRLGIGMGRAEKIARTEINQSYRTAYLDEAKELNETALKDDDWKIRQAHRSALAITTREHHAARHSTIHTIQQQKDWWATGANAINCLCSTLDVLVNTETGEALQGKMIKVMQKQRKQWFNFN